MIAAAQRSRKHAPAISRSARRRIATAIAAMEAMAVQLGQMRKDATKDDIISIWDLQEAQLSVRHLANTIRSTITTAEDGTMDGVLSSEFFDVVAIHQNKKNDQPGVEAAILAGCVACSFLETALTFDPQFFQGECGIGRAYRGVYAMWCLMRSILLGLTSKAIPYPMEDPVAILTRTSRKEQAWSR